MVDQRLSMARNAGETTPDPSPYQSPPEDGNVFTWNVGFDVRIEVDIEYPPEMFHLEQIKNVSNPAQLFSMLQMRPTLEHFIKNSL